MKSQTFAVLEYLNKNGSITPQEALHHLSVMRLAARILELKEMGYDIYKTMIDAHNKKGDLIKVARYWLKQ